MRRRRFMQAGAAAVAGGFLNGCAAPSPSAVAVTDLSLADAVTQIELIRSGRASALEVLDAAIARAEAVNPQINAIVTNAFEQARARAASLPNGAITGLPYLIKDLTEVAGVRTTFGSRLFTDNMSSTDSPYVAAINRSGGNIFGKTNTPEYGLVATTESLELGPCRNPWNLNYSTGGSSGGAAAAVAAGIVPVAQASDGGGSIRIPASCCGLVGLKTSRGRTAGEQNDTQLSDIAVRHAVSRSVRDNALLLSVTEARGGAAGLQPVGFVTAPLDRPLRIAFSTQSAKGSQPDRDVQAAQMQTARLCERLGHKVVEAAPQYDGVEFENAFLDLWSEAPSGLVKQTLASGVPENKLGDYFEPWTLFLVEHFESVGAAGKARANEVFKRVERSVKNFMQDYDVWLTPVLSSAPPRIGAQAPTVPVDQLLKRTFDYVAYTPLANVLGTPAISLPLNWNATGLPIGSMFMAKYGQEALLLELAYQIEQAQPWSARRPQVIA